MQIQSDSSSIVIILTSITSSLVSATNQTIQMIGLAALKISAALMAVFKWCKLPFSKAGPSTPHKFEYRNLSLEERKEVSSRTLRNYPDRIAVIVERHFASHAPTIDKPKFIAPQEITATKFKNELKKHMSDRQQDIAFFIDNGKNTVLPLPAGNMKTIAENYTNEDGFLYIYYTSPGERV